jgi:hypothetical protein
VAERAPLDLTDILKQYEVFGGANDAGVRATGDGWWQQPPASVVERQEEERRIEEKRFNEPQIIGRESMAVFSTCTALQRSPLWCADVNGYYRTLGVHWRATKKELREAFLALGPMPTAYQMYVLKQLLDDEVRREYDRTPLGTPYLNDDYMQAAIKAKASEEARRRSQQGTPTSAEEVISEQYDYIKEAPKNNDDSPSQVVDEEVPKPEDAELSDPASTFRPWPYGYYVWKTKADNTETLREWQELLVRAFSERGEITDLAVGFVGRMAHRYVVARVGTRHVIFLGDEQTPTEELAGSAADALLRDMNKTRTTS